MKPTTMCLALLLLLGGTARAQPPRPVLPSAHQATVNRYCAGCHNDKRLAGGFSWSTIDLADPGQNAEPSEKVIRRLRAGMMPPAGAPRPEPAIAHALITAMETAIDRRAADRPHAGAPELHRVNRTEYRNSIRELLALDIDVASLLPPDELAGGFDNMSNALAVTPALVQGYVRAASKISRAAIGDPHVAPTMSMYKVPKVVNQMRHVDGAPLGTRGGTSLIHHFPADGEYTFKLAFYYDFLETLYGQSLPGNLQGQEIEVSVDGARVAIFTIDPNIPETKNALTSPAIQIAAGPHRVSAAFIAKFDGPTEDQFRQVEQSMIDITAGVPGLIALPHLLSLTVAGPFQVTGLSDTPSRRKIFTCRPPSPPSPKGFGGPGPTSSGVPNSAAASGAPSKDETTCAQQIIARLARQAFRRPLTGADTEFLFSYYKEGRKEGGFESGIRMAVQAIVANPQFVFRLERVPQTAKPGTNFRVDDLDLASRLSYFLWSSSPDDQLLTLASQGKLKDPTVLEREVRRLLADRRSQALVENFAYQWLRLQSVKEADPDGGLFPQFSRNLGESMTRETKLLFESIMREDRSIVDLLTADYTFVDEVLAKHYGIPNIQGSTFQRVPVADPNRVGLLGHGSILTLTSYANRTSPVIRGKYVMEVLLGVAPPPPPADVPALAENVENQKPLPVRERLAEHRRNPACASCHNMMDPIGLSLENFNAVGLWRAHDSGAPVDPSGQMYDGTKLDGPASLRLAVVNHTASFVGSFTQNLLSYGLGRLVDYRDMPAVRAIDREATANGYRFSSFVLGIVKSVPFQMRQADEVLTTATKTTGATSGKFPGK